MDPLRRKRVSRVFDNDATLRGARNRCTFSSDFIIHRLAEKAAADASLAGQQPYKTALRGDQDWSGGAITKHCQGDDTDFKTLAGSAAHRRMRRLPSTNTPGSGKPALRRSAASDARLSGTRGGEPLRHPEPGPPPDAVVVVDVLSGQSTWSPASARRDVLQRREHRPQ